MSDERLRELERRHREEGTVEAEAAWLVARLRAGDVAWDDVALDAYLGHAPAQVALVEPVRPVRFEGEDARFRAPAPWGELPIDDRFSIWLRGFAAWGPELLARALLAHAHALLDETTGRSPVVRLAVEAVNAWCRAPDAGTTDAVTALAWAARTPDPRTGRTAEHVVCTFARVVGAQQTPAPLPALLRECLGKPVRAAALRRVLRGWPLEPRIAVDLPVGDGIRERVERAITPIGRRELVHRIRAAGEWVVLRLRDGTTRRFAVERVGYDRVLLPDHVFAAGWAAAHVDLDEVVEVVPAPAR